MSIVTSLLHANYKENLMTGFSANKPIFKGLYIFIHVAMAMAHTLTMGFCINSIIKKKTFVLLGGGTREGWLDVA